MQEDTFSAAEKILSDIENVLIKDTSLQSFEIIPVNDNQNKSPVYHEENSLGLASWCVQPLYCYTYNRLIELRGKKLRREDPSTASRWLMGALLLNPDVATFWNMKRELIRSGRLDALQELHFTQIVLYHKAKCFEAFAYRRWLIEFLLVEGSHPNVDVELMLKTERDVAAMAANRYANNYHAWSHRQYVLTTYEALVPANFDAFLLSEWEFSRKWCSQHISDHSGNAYRQFLLKRFLLVECQANKSKLFFTSQHLAERRAIVLSYIKSGVPGDRILPLSNESCKLLDLLHGKEKTENTEIKHDHILVILSYWIEDCSVNEDLINCYSGHESLWYHRRFLAYALRCLETSFLKYSHYKAEFFQPRNYTRLHDDQCTTEDSQESKGLLEIAFKNRNDELIATIKQKNDHQRDIIEKFVKFLAVLRLKS